MSTSAHPSATSLHTVRKDKTAVRAAQRARSVPEILKDGVAAHGSAMVVRALPALSADSAQRAVVASRKVGGAVSRNRAKRRLREAVRAAGLPEDLDIVVIARVAALSAPMPHLAQEVSELLQRVRDRLPQPAGGAG